MNAIPLADVLQSFEPVPARFAADEEPEAAAPPIDFDARLEEAAASARDEGREEGRQAAQAEFQAEMEQERAAFEQRLIAERAEWADQTARLLAERFDQALNDLCEEIRRQFVVILGPFLEQTVREKAVEQAIDSVQRLLGDNVDALIHISGPPNLIERIRAVLAETDRSIECVETEDSDLKIAIRDTVIETRIRDWLAVAVRLEGLGQDV